MALHNDSTFKNLLVIINCSLLIINSQLKCVPEERLELSRKLLQRLLRPQRLPISPSGLSDVRFTILDLRF